MGGQNFNLNLNNFLLPISQNFFLEPERVVLVKFKACMVIRSKEVVVVIVDGVHSN